MSKNKIKIMMAALTLLLSLIMLAGASLAWFTMSTSPEVKGMQVFISADRALLVSADNSEDSYGQWIDMSEAFAYFAPLKPVSTVDGINWFIPTYKDDASGALNPISEFLRDDANGNGYVHGNSLMYYKTETTDSDGNVTYTYTPMPESGSDYFNATNNGYYVYASFWLKTELEEGCDVTISVPNGRTNLEEWEKEDDPESDGGKYGSYALAAYEMDDAGIYRVDNNAQTALRVGFLVTELNEDGSEKLEGGRPVTNFVIWEPNADQRSVGDAKPGGAAVSGDGYIHGFQQVPNPAYDPDDPNETDPKYLNYSDGLYIPTRPIGMVNGSPQLVDVPSTNLLVQRACRWHLIESHTTDEQGNITSTTYSGRLYDRLVGNGVPNSNDVDTFGKFVTDNTRLTLTDGVHEFVSETAQSNYYGLASNNMIVHLEKDEPREITMFVWIEGQDVDCWNDIASGSFFLNIELAAQSDEE